MRYLALALISVSTLFYAVGNAKPTTTTDCIRASRADLSADEKEVLASFQALLDGLGKRDKTAMMAQMLPSGSAVLMRNGKPAQMTLEMLADRLSQPGTEAREERIHNAIVHVDGDVATVWAPFEFLVDGKMDHCGRDIANLIRVDGRWIIAGIEDNGRKDCGGH
jgi:Putative lumazine-binding